MATEATDGVRPAGPPLEVNLLPNDEIVDATQVSEEDPWCGITARAW